MTSLRRICRGCSARWGCRRSSPVPPQTLRHCLDALNDPALASAWDDDTTLGWVYQYWNDPEREGLDAKLNNREARSRTHEIASKTQLFTEQYMVEWLLQNSLNQTWLAICSEEWLDPRVPVSIRCSRPRWNQRREEWREKREAGEVEPGRS